MSKVTISPEYDGRSIWATTEVLRSLGARRLGGERLGNDFSWEEWILQDRRLRLEAETYMGFTVEGPDELVATVARLVNERLKTQRCKEEARRGGYTRRALLFIRSGRFLPETPETAEAISLAGRNASFLTLSIERTPEKRGKTR